MNIRDYEIRRHAPQALRPLLDRIPYRHARLAEAIPLADPSSPTAPWITFGFFKIRKSAEPVATQPAEVANAALAVDASSLPGPRPRYVDVTSEVIVTDLGEFGRQYRYGDVFNDHGVTAIVAPDGAFRCNVRAGGYRPRLGGGRDMVVSVTQRIAADGIEVKRWIGFWDQGNSVNHDAFAENKRRGQSDEQAASGTWTARLAAEHGFTQVDSVRRLTDPNGQESIEVEFTRPRN